MLQASWRAGGAEACGMERAKDHQERHSEAASHLDGHPQLQGSGEQLRQAC